MLEICMKKGEEDFYLDGDLKRNSPGFMDQRAPIWNNQALDVGAAGPNSRVDSAGWGRRSEAHLLPLISIILTG